MTRQLYGEVLEDIIASTEFEEILAADLERPERSTLQPRDGG